MVYSTLNSNGQFGVLHSELTKNKEGDYEKAVGLAKKVAPTNVNVVLYGETGTGKEYFADKIVELSDRSEYNFVKVNCSAIPNELLESELFGHKKGSFTGATSDKTGLFELAAGGTILIDEIGDMPSNLQPKLLRVLQDKMIQPIGSIEARKVDFRCIFATNVDLLERCESGHFRKDLFFRINNFPIHIPPLRNRYEDIESLTHYFLDKKCTEMGRETLNVSPELIESLKNYRWPGNIRELESMIERAIIISNGNHLTIESSFFIPESRLSDRKQPVDINELTKKHIIETLEKTNWKVSGPGSASELLGLNSNTLSSKLRKLGIKKPKGY